MVKELQNKFEKACRNNNLTIVKHLLESSLKEHITVTEDVIKDTLGESNFELSDYLLSKANNIQKQEIISHAFAMACYRDDIKLVKALYFSENYKPFLSLDYNSTWCFRTAYSNNRLEVLDFLINEAKLSKNAEDVHREMYMIYPQKEEILKHCEALFLYQNITENLVGNSLSITRKTKI